MKMPNAERAVVDVGKLTAYSLNRQHEAGKHKARVFQSALGITISEADWLRERLLQSVLEEEAFEGAPSPFGRKYVVDIWLQRGECRAQVRSTWIIEYGKDFPRLTSCYVI